MENLRGLHVWRSGPSELNEVDLSCCFSTLLDVTCGHRRSFGLDDGARLFKYHDEPSSGLCLDQQMFPSPERWIVF